MPRDLYAQFTDTSMDADQIDRLLESQGYGIISLCEEGTPYSLPVSFGYDGERVYIPFLLTGGDETKTGFIEEDTGTRLLVTDVRDRFDWRSVSIAGTVQSVDPEGEEWDHFIDVLVDNGWFMGGFQRAESIESIQGWKLSPEEVQGMERRAIPFE